jgi:hypothetical protein
MMGIVPHILMITKVHKHNLTKCTSGWKHYTATTPQCDQKECDFFAHLKYTFCFSLLPFWIEIAAYILEYTTISFCITALCLTCPVSCKLHLLFCQEPE